MQNSFSTNTNMEAAAILHLIQRTPCVEVLIKMLRRRGFPSIDEKTVGTRFQKCRRLYDALLQECHSYNEDNFDQLKKLFQDSGNGEAGELLSGIVKGPPAPLYLGPSSSSDHLSRSNLIFSPLQLSRTDISTSSHAMMRIFRVAKIGNAPKLEILLRGVALKCAGFESLLTPNVTRNAAAAVNINRYRESLGEVLLSKKDWIDKTLLHTSVDGKSVACIDIVLQFGQEALRKGDLVDAQDAFGQTALYLAIKRKYTQITKKLIGEGSDLFLPNNAGQTPLGLIFQRLPAITTFLLDRSVTISGDHDSLFLNIDFGILTAPIDITKDMGESPKLYNGIRLLKPEKDSDSCRKVVLDLDSDSDDKENSPMVDISPQRQIQQETLITVTKENPMPENAIKISKTKKQYYHPHVEMAVLSQMVNSGNKCLSNILSHCVTKTFLDLKWERLRLLLWVTYTGLRMGIYGLYIVLMYRIYFYHCPLNRKLDSGKCGSSPWMQGLLSFVILFNSAFLLHEVIKAADLRKMRHFKRYLIVDPGPYVFIRMLSLSILIGTCCPPLVDVDGTLNGYQYILATFGILTSAGLILGVLGNSNCNFGIYSIYIHIYGKVMLRFLSVLATFSPLVISFSLAFNIMYPQMKQFSSFFRSLFRLIIMLQGEFDFEDKMYDGSRPLDNEERTNSTSQLSKNDEQLIFWAGQFLFGLLGCVLTLVLIDVFLGYTVSDINELKTQAEFVRRWNQVVQMDEAERFIQLTARFIELFGLSSDSFVDYFNVISTKRRKHYRTDMVISFDELSESRQAQFRQILIEPS